VKRFEVLIVDEIEQVLRNLPYIKDNKTIIVQALIWFLNNARYAVVLDADISDLTRNFIATYCPQRPVFNVENKFLIGKGRRLITYLKPSDIIEGAKQALKRGENVFIACNHKNRALDIDVALKGISEQGRFISADNSGEPWVKNFFENPNEAVKEVSYFVVTPAVTTGLSIDSIDGVAAVNYVAGIFKENTTLPTDNMQAIGRVRDAQEIHLYISPKKGKKPQTRAEIEAHLLALGKEKGRVLPEAQTPEITLDSEGRRVLSPLPTTSIYIEALMFREAGLHDLFHNTLELAAKAGYTHAWGDSVQVHDKYNAELKEKGQAVYEAAILSAEDIDEETARELKKKKRTQAQTNSLHKRELLDTYRGIPLKEAIEADKRGRGRLAVRRALGALEADEVIKRKWDAQADNPLEDTNAYVANAMLFEWLCYVAGIDRATLTPTGERYSKDSKEVGELVARVIEKRSDLVGACRIPSDYALKANPVKWINEQLKRFGVAVVSHTHAEGNRTYSVEPRTLEMLRTIATAHRLCFAVTLAA